MTFNYTKLFQPSATLGLLPEDNKSIELVDRASSLNYVYEEEIILAINVALATGRPLLIRGPSGSGKSSLAKSVADQSGRSYIETIITSRTQARDLQWQVDLLKRLQDAQSGQQTDDWTRYVMPGALWWAFDPVSAALQLKTMGNVKAPQGITIASEDSKPLRTVLLIDEIDKADPDMPNNLLKPLGSLAFEVEELGLLVEAVEPPVVFITTNEERDLPPAFLRRCVELVMPAFDRNRLIAVGLAHFPQVENKLLATTADLFLEKSSSKSRRNSINAAEYLDMIRACQDLQVDPDSTEFKQLAEIVLWKKGGGR